MGKKNLRKKKGLALMIYLLKKLSCVLDIIMLLRDFLK